MYKKIFAVLVLLASSSLSSLANATPAPETELLDCQGPNIEGAGISLIEGRLEGSVEWDCWPGGGVCESRSWLVETRNTEGDIVLLGASFEMTIYADSHAYIKAVDNTATSADQGRGLAYGGEVSCTRKQPAGQ